MGTVKLTVSFKLEGKIPNIFSLYKKVVNEILNYTSSKNTSSFKRLKKEKYHELRTKYPDLPSHYIYTACQMTCLIYKSFRKLRLRAKLKEISPCLKRML